MEEMRTRLSLQDHAVLHTRTTDFPGNYVGYNDAWDFDKFKKNFTVKLIRKEENVLEFDMVGIDAAIANAFRRILIAEVPTMAVEKVIFHNNTSVIPDEILASRLGLIPIKADPKLFEFREPGDENGSPENTLEFHLKVRCSKRPHAPKDATSRDDLLVHHSVYSGDIKWIPIGSQETMFKEEDVGPVDKDILIAKLQPGHEVDIRMQCVKGIGRDHAKFSPVSPVSYRLLPEIILTKPIMNEDAIRLQDCFSQGVIEIEETKGGKVAKVVNPRMDTCSRNVLRHEDLKPFVKMQRVRDYFIFVIESTGALSPDILFGEAIGILKRKCKSFLDELDSDKK
uniref:DNA-directed RNA polymerases I and III subunit RPAC1 n=1 Tax=Strigamia maritima TaxID=126957 RepID=T1J5W7_STRMM